ncbi:hypothetical protein [Streptomyces sp. NPDC093970]|uniref:hypothetical protein n=1 Tax=Streptomyces sp. NPDC093970 TaxID=3155076 RepID=UPI00342956C3
MVLPVAEALYLEALAEWATEAVLGIFRHRSGGRQEVRRRHRVGTHNSLCELNLYGGITDQEHGGGENFQSAIVLAQLPGPFRAVYAVSAPSPSCAGSWTVPLISEALRIGGEVLTMGGEAAVLAFHTAVPSSTRQLRRRSSHRPRL